MTYKAHKTIKAGIQEVTGFFNQKNMAHDYFPEVHKDTKSFSNYVFQTHKHPYQVTPDYRIQGIGLGWTTGGGTYIRLPRKDINAEIQAIDIEYKSVGENTKIIINVEFNPAMNLKGFVAMSHIRMMVNNKLNAFKNDIEVNQHQGWLPAFA